MDLNINEIVDGALINAIAVVGRRVSVAIDGVLERRRADDLTTARWFETYRFTREVPPDLVKESTVRGRLAEILNGDDIQAALQELLAVRLTDSPENAATRVRGLLDMTLSAAGPDVAQYAKDLAKYYDDQICDLVARLEGEESPLLAQIRSEAFSTYMMAILNAIERHTAALTARPSQRTEESFLASYRSHVIDHHGKLEPPDFDRRRRIPLQDIYIPSLITEKPPILGKETPEPTTAPSLNIFDLAEKLFRSVLLGHPGGGKTTASNVLMHYFADNKKGRIPFLITLREFAAKYPPERSVAGYIEYTLDTFYQCPPPPRLIDLLLLTGRAVVIFDGLDELLDTSRRADVTARVERFCAEYPLTPVLVTSRLIGYDQARLDDTRFNCYWLGEFTEDQVGEYAHKWFAQDVEMNAGEAESWANAFLAESTSASDLRTNPLMLALLCILYRGEQSLPRDRAGVYEQCALLLFRKWDTRRRIYRELSAEHLLEATLRHLSWWLFSRDDAKSAVTERELIATTTSFLRERGFESIDRARDAAREFVEFCRGRMWVFTDVGTSSTGERLYAFTHRTFLEYFAAAQIAFESDSPVQLAKILVPHLARQEWVLLAELAVQIKDSTINNGAQRIYAAFLAQLSHYPYSPDSRAAILEFLASCLQSVDPSPPRIRELVRRILEDLFDKEKDINPGDYWADNSISRSLGGDAARLRAVLKKLVSNCGTYCDTVADEFNIVATGFIRSGDATSIANAVRFSISLIDIFPESDWPPHSPQRSFWESHVDTFMRAHSNEVVLVAESDTYVRLVALKAGLITRKQARDMPGGVKQRSHSYWQLFFIDQPRPFIIQTTGTGMRRQVQPGSLGSAREHSGAHATPPQRQGRRLPQPASLTTYAVKSVTHHRRPARTPP